MQFEEVEILYVEDNPLDAELTLRALKRGGLANKVLHLKTGQQALDYLFRQGEFAQRTNELPRLVLLDLKMPGLDGIEVLNAMRADERTKRIPVVVMTSSQDQHDVSQAYKLGINSYLVKPVDFDAFAEVVREAGFYWLAINRTARP
jgi:two-component system, response regulator